MSAVLANPVLIGVFVFCGIASSLLGLAGWTSVRRRIIEERIRSVSGNNRAPAGDRRLAKRSNRFSLLSLVSRSSARKQSLRGRLLEAGLYEPSALATYIVMQFISAALLCVALPIAAFFGRIAWEYALCAAAPAALLGMYLPHVWLEHRRARRQLALRRALPDFLDLIVACVAGGLSIQAALSQVAEELSVAHAELAGELRITLREIELGTSLDHALLQLAGRTGLEELRTLRSFVQQATKFGTTITNALEQMAEMLRVQRAQRAEELAQKAVVKILFPTLLFIFPTVFVVLAGPAAIQIKEGVEASTANQSVSESLK